MSHDTGRFWRAAAEGCRTSTAEGWRERIGDDWKRHVGLFREGRRPVETIPCRTPCGYGCHRRVHHGDDGVARAICHERDEDAYTLSEEALEQWELCPDRLAEKVADALARHDGEGRGRAEAAPINNLWQIGWTPVPAWLLLEPGRTRWPESLTRVLTELQPPGRLLLPAAGMMGDEFRRLLAERGWAVAALEDWLAMDDGGDWFFPDRLPEPASTRPTTPVSTPEDYSFVCLGKTWRMVFEGQEFTMDHSRGCLALSYLLESPHQVIPPLRLDALMRGHGPRHVHPSGIEAMDKDGDSYFAHQASVLQARIEGNDPAGAAEAREELSALEARINKDRGLGKRPRRVSDDRDAARKNIGRLLTTAINAMKDASDAACRHFRSSITPNSFDLAYRPSSAILWTIDRRKAPKK